MQLLLVVLLAQLQRDVGVTHLTGQNKIAGLGASLKSLGAYLACTLFIDCPSPAANPLEICDEHSKSCVTMLSHIV